MNPDIVIRLAGEEDELALRRVAQRDSAAHPPRGVVLVAECEGVMRAALSVTTGEVVADPFAPTAAVVDLLRLRAAQLRADEGVGRESVTHRRFHGQPLRRTVIGGSG